MLAWMAAIMSMSCGGSEAAVSAEQHAFHARRSQALPRPSAREVAIYCANDHWAVHLWPSQRVAEAELIVDGPQGRGFAQLLAPTSRNRSDDRQMFVGQLPILDAGRAPGLQWQTELPCSPIDGREVRARVELRDATGTMLGCTALAHRRPGCDTLEPIDPERTSR